ncbi:translocon-associated protein subunit alpha-like [Dendronephthya gigantea]|uniref:translocon-associated protein subunit alpha-like n=1 Tax=Dendronephthya gigantea TaxID=151771 RepID=UPI00106DB45C|nr:translocon-associated protein subunit alpha-like [Dendronephthya gigantea]
MFSILKRLLFLLLLVFPAVIFITNQGSLGVVGEDDEVIDDEDVDEDAGDDAEDDSEEEDGRVETEDEGEGEEPELDEAQTTEADTTGEQDVTEEEDLEIPTLTASPDAETTILFTSHPEQEIAAGSIVDCLVGFTNNGKNDFVIEALDASLRYPQDYSYFIQNFTTRTLNRLVKPGEQATFDYAFKPHENLGGRPFGIVVALYYKDAEGKDWMDSVFNETVTFKEHDEGFDGETFFLYVFVAAMAILIIMGAQYILSSLGKKKSAKPYVEMGTQQKSDVDMDWLPKETTTEFGKNSPRRSPRNRRQKRNPGAGED